jgi:hypothetical protein
MIRALDSGDLQVAIVGGGQALNAYLSQKLFGLVDWKLTCISSFRRTPESRRFLFGSVTVDFFRFFFTNRLCRKQ